MSVENIQTMREDSAELLIKLLMQVNLDDFLPYLGKEVDVWHSIFMTWILVRRIYIVLQIDDFFIQFFFLSQYL